MTNWPDDDFELLPSLDGSAGPAKRISSARADTLVKSVLDGTASAAAPARVPRRLRIALTAAALVAFAGVASAGLYTIVQRNPPSTPHRASPPEPEPVGPVDPEPVVVEDVAESEPTPSLNPEPIAAPEQPTAPKDLVRMANARRGDKRYRVADRLYQRVIRSHPRSAEAYVATVASAQLRLDHLGRPKSALRLYRRALALQPAGALAEEARFGVAEAHRALGNNEAEAAALAVFLERHPGSPLRGRAQARHAALTR